MEKPQAKRRRVSSFQMILLGFLGVIVIGALLLMLPLSSRSGAVTPFSDALFTSTSAVCVTGLVVLDTASYWSYFGQAVILVLIQIGGLGVITMTVLIALLAGRRISLMQRSTIQEAITAPQIGGVVRMTRFILIFTFSAELIGALLLAPAFYADYGAEGLWKAVFHAVSAFCNAGFDLMGTQAEPFVSLTGYGGRAYVNVVLMLLIVSGGLGFLTWDDIRKNRLHVGRYRMQSKVVLVTSALLIALPAVYFYFCEFAQTDGKERVLAALFQSVTTRTAGFNTADLTLLTGGGMAVFLVLMLIGGSPGSTAGGMKTTTAAVLFVNMISVFRRDEEVHCFGRRLGEGAIRNAAAIAVMYVILFLGGALIISTAEGLPFSSCLFETASAAGTVGLTLGLTPQLSQLSRVVLMILMFCGRVGGLTVIYAAFSGRRRHASKLPQEQIAVG